MTAPTTAEIEWFVALGHSQSARNCRVLIADLHAARADRNSARAIIRDMLEIPIDETWDFTDVRQRARAYLESGK